MKNIIILAVTVISISLFSCKKEKETITITPEDTTGTLTLGFKAGFKEQALKLNGAKYALDNGDSITNVSSFKFYISNVKLRRKSSGTYFDVPNSYYLFDLANAEHGRVEHANNFHIKGIPANEYDQILFAIGIDNFQNSNGNQSGWLDPNYGMLWTWSSGYKFTVLEGTVRAKDSTSTQPLLLHVGNNANFKSVKFDLSKTVVLKKQKESTVAFWADINEIFVAPKTLALKDYKNVMGGAGATDAANNYVDMIKLKDVTNE